MEAEFRVFSYCAKLCKTSFFRQSITKIGGLFRSLSFNKSLYCLILKALNHSALA